MSKIEKFCKDVLGITLLPIQVQMLNDFADGNWHAYPKKSGITTANKALRAYIKESLKEEINE